MQARHAYGPAVAPEGTRRRTRAHTLDHTPAGLIYSIVTMPFETAKNRMAFQKMDPVTKEMPYRGTFQTIGKVAAADGVLSLWWGFLPYYGRCGGHTVTMFIFVDQIRSAYRKTFMKDK